MKDYIAKLKAKPEHVRKRIALGTSVGVTGLIGVIWLTTMAASGTFALGSGSQTASAADATDQGQDQGQQNDSANMALTNTNVKTNFSQLMGAVGAATGATTSKPSLTVVDGGTTSTFNAKQPAANTNSATVIPF